MNEKKNQFKRAARIARLMQGAVSKPIWNEMNSMLEKIKLEENDILVAMRTAQDYFDGGYRTQLENLGAIEPGSSERDFGSGYKLHSPSGSVDCELDETSRALVYAASRNESVETPLN